MIITYKRKKFNFIYLGGLIQVNLFIAFIMMKKQINLLLLNKGQTGLLFLDIRINRQMFAINALNSGRRTDENN